MQVWVVIAIESRVWESLIAGVSLVFHKYSPSCGSPEEQAEDEHHANKGKCHYQEVPPCGRTGHLR